MTDAIAGFFYELGRRGHEPSLEKARGSIRFDLVAGSRTDRWLVTLDKGDVSVSRRNITADCVVRTDRTLFDGMVTGDVNGMAAYDRRGDIEASLTDPTGLFSFDTRFLSKWVLTVDGNG